MKRWEHKILVFSWSLTSSSIEDYLNRAGAEGWELVHIQETANNKLAYLKREAAEK